MLNLIRPSSAFTQQTLRTTFSRSTISASQIPRISKANMATDASKPNIETKDVQTAPGITLSEQQNTVVGSVLDLFAGRPSLKKLALWRDDATFTDPITIAQGRDKYAAQWYGLQSAFSEIERLHHSVKDAGNPILMDLKTRYVVKGIGKETTIESVVAIYTDEQGKISKVEDKWNGKLPDGAIANAFRHLNAVTVPKLISVPKNDEEDAQRGNQ
ncbi:SnoaL-2 domain containing protein [Pyrenophora tritici-repentis]|uniref:SnoaL-2 domain containing protein n=3 Tax=Pyrenophora tritici-repentis TaxID=45151 RepID=A0A2W1EUI0_9PLEO|nr:SnoaL-2 domain-containing protein [Pyrenophora tritici-repentis]KAF7577583.1 SnoaL-2 domain containing protein [Pyrenophora tritici-repentis]KAG9388211.1 SnoaL-2 domain containing protein [Pyrenophora tritici-repentis]KAI0579410.1 SnoaL-2 domain-containing protein [Pyrenophora tritici-repentis]KAI0587067.1 SnoaL-2 domain-containing protein [Pyrenophora tritici-repentis]